MAALPPSIAGRAEMSVAVKLALAILREKIPELNSLNGRQHIRTLIQEPERTPLILVRDINPLGFWAGTKGFVDVAQIKVDTFTDGVNAEDDGALLQQVVRQSFQEAWQTKPQKIYTAPGLHASLNWLTVTQNGTQVTDWATSSGPVQFADLDQGLRRFESRYELVIRNWP